MLQLDNPGPFAASIVVFPNRDAIDTLYVIVKAAFTLSRTLAVAEKPIVPVPADVYWGEPGQSSLKYASEFHVGNAGTDVALIGKTWAPGGAPVDQTTVRVAVAERIKTVAVFGDRTWTRGGGISRPAPFSSMPLVFERAFGGVVEPPRGGAALSEEGNPVGVGFLGNRPAGEVVGQRLPNLEDPRKLLQRPGDRPPPAAFGFVAPAWQPRRAYAGTYDRAWQQRRAPYLPPDFDPRFFNAATPELKFDRFLTGGEPVEVIGASRSGPLRFDLPRERPIAEIDVMGTIERPPTFLETVLIEPDDDRVCLTWRAALPCDRKVLKVKQIKIRVDG